MRLRKELNEKDIDNIFYAKVADALGHPIRVAIFRYIQKENEVKNDVCNSDLVSHFDYSQAAISQHVKKLVDADLFTIEKKDKFSMYSINKTTLKKFKELLK